MQKDKKMTISPARRVASAGLVAALSCMLLYLSFIMSAVMPRFSALLILSLLPVVLAYERRFADAILAYASSALISGLLFPAPLIWLLYAAFFGWYGIFREFIVTKLNKIWSWVILAAAFNVAFFALYFLASQLLFENIKIPHVLLIPIAEAAFVVFEIFFGICRKYYAERVRRVIFRR
jgi:hypothetical protein